MDEQIIEQMQKVWQTTPNGCNLPWKAVYAVVEQHLKAKHAEEMLEPLTREERALILTSNGQCDCERLLADRKLRFLAPAAKERVTVISVGETIPVHKVLLDGGHKFEHRDKKIAEWVAAGLRAELEGK